VNEVVLIVSMGHYPLQFPRMIVHKEKESAKTRTASDSWLYSKEYTDMEVTPEDFLEGPVTENLSKRNMKGTKL
jgi:hypothetical protein